MTAPGFAVLTRLLAGVASRHAGGRLALVTEGGYDLDALDASLHAVLEAATDGTDRDAPPMGGDQSRGRRAAEAARAALAAHWRF